MLKIPAAIWAGIEEHAARSYPEECCGVLLGEVREDFGRAGRCVTALESRPLDNVWEGPARGSRYQVEPSAVLSIEREFAGTGRGIVGFYHSHPNVPAWPSPFDLMRAWPCYSYPILSVKDGQPAEARSWVRSEDGRDFVPEELVIE